MKNIEIQHKGQEEVSRLEDIINWYLHNEKDLLVVEDFEDITHYINLDTIKFFTVEDK